MAKNKILQIVATECAPDVDEKFNKWYNEVHVPMLYKNKNLKKVARYKLQGEAPGQAKYLALYEYEDQKSVEEFQKSSETMEAFKEMGETWKDVNNMKWVASYELIKSWER